jgi:hypothetical protein
MGSGVIRVIEMILWGGLRMAGHDNDGWASSELRSRSYPQPIPASSNFSKFSDLKNSSFLLSERFTSRKPISTNPSKSVRAVWYMILKIFFTSLIVIIFSGLSDE